LNFDKEAAWVMPPDFNIVSTRLFIQLDENETANTYC